MLITSQVTKLQMYDTKIESLDGSENKPKYQELINNNNHLKGIKVEDEDIKEQLPAYAVLGSGEYARIKTTYWQRWSKWQKKQSSGGF